MFEITNLSSKKTPVSAKVVEEIKNRILGKKYNLSLVYTTNSYSKKLNKKYRNKNKSANVLSFPFSKNDGEIFINLETKKEEAQKFNMSFKKYISYLLIHGALHLKGHDHGHKMDKEEDRFLKLL
jgi:probable rRNA maturation factor